MNKVIIVGNLVKDPEIREVKVGTDTIKNCRFRIAVARKNEEEADFFNVVVWRKQAENCGKYLRKGSKVGIVGRLTTSSFTGKDGKSVQTVEISAEEVEFLSRIIDGDKSGKEKIETEEPVLTPIDDSQMPF